MKKVYRIYYFDTFDIGNESIEYLTKASYEDFESIEDAENFLKTCDNWNLSIQKSNHYNVKKERLSYTILPEYTF